MDLQGNSPVLFIKNNILFNLESNIYQLLKYISLHKINLHDLISKVNKIYSIDNL